MSERKPVANSKLHQRQVQAGREEEGMMLDIIALRRKIYRELRRTHKDWDCFTECRERVAYRERLATLQYVIGILGGKKAETRTTISDLK
jgi:hypothetical protein